MNEIWNRFKSVNWTNYWFKFLLKTPERLLAGIISGLIVYLLMSIL